MISIITMIRMASLRLLFVLPGLVLHTSAGAADSAASLDLAVQARAQTSESPASPSADDNPSFEMEAAVDRLVQDEDEMGGSKPGLLRWAEYRVGQRPDDSVLNESSTMNELRAQLAYQKNIGNGLFSTRADVLLDEAADEAQFDFREFEYSTKLSDNLSMTLGRQTITWLMGDILPVNDFFPKDFNSYFIGRDAEGEYMKSPSDALQLNVSTGSGQFDLVYAPRFASNSYPEGERLSYFSPITQAVEGEANPMPHRVDDKAFTNDAWYGRYSRQVGGNEVFLFLYDGYWMEPNSIDPGTQEFYHAPLRSYGGAWRGASLGGLLTLEAAYYDSPDDPAGDNPLIPNDQLRGLVRYDRELAKNLNMTAQYYTEHRMKQGAYERTLPVNSTPKAEAYEQYTLRLTKNFLKQTLSFSGFGYYSPTEDDSYFRLNVSYQPDDHWKYYAGVNIFEGESNDTRWGQYEDNSNIFAGIRYNW